VVLGLSLDHIEGRKGCGKGLEGAAQNGDIVSAPEIEGEEGVLREQLKISALVSLSPCDLPEQRNRVISARG